MTGRRSEPAASIRTGSGELWASSRALLETSCLALARLYGPKSRSMPGLITDRVSVFFLKNF